MKTISLIFAVLFLGFSCVTNANTFTLNSASAITSSTNWYSNAIDTNGLHNLSLAMVTNGATGTLNLQLADDVVGVSNPASVGQSVQAWATYVGQSFTGISAGFPNYVFSLSAPGFRWIRAQFVPSSGTGTITVNGNTN